MSAHTHFWHDHHVSLNWRQALVGAVIVVLASLGLYDAISKWQKAQFTEGFLSLGLLVSQTVVYAFGYFWCLPELLGRGTALDQSRSLRQRWSDFGLLSTFFAVVVMSVVYVRVIWLNFPYVDLARAIVLLAVCLWMLPACVVASERYLGSTPPPHGQSLSGSGWRARARRIMKKPGSWLVGMLGTKTSTAAGAVLVLASLALVVDGDIFGPDFRGYEVIAGSSDTVWSAYYSPSWPTARDVGIRALTDTHRAVYGLGLLAAFLGLCSLTPERWGGILRESRIPAFLAGTVVLYEVTDIATGFWREVYGNWTLVLWIGSWSVPVVVWLKASNGREKRDRVRAAILVFYLPFFMISFALLVFFSYLAAGYGSFMIGMLLLWWGLAQGEREPADSWESRPA